MLAHYGDLQGKQQKSAMFKVEYGLSFQCNFLFQEFCFMDSSVLNLQFIKKARTAKDRCWIKSGPRPCHGLPESLHCRGWRKIHWPLCVHMATKQSTSWKKQGWYRREGPRLSKEPVGSRVRSHSARWGEGMLPYKCLLLGYTSPKP